MKKYFKVLFATVNIFLVLTGIVNATTLVIDSGKLIGANDVIIGDNYYSVMFEEGNSYDLLYDYENQYWDFDFTTAEDAISASRSLVDQVLNGYYSTNPEEIFGYFTRNPIDVGIRFLTPYETRSSGSMAYGSTWYHESTNIFSPSWGLISTNDFGTINNSSIFALWTPTGIVPVPDNSPVPEPTTILLFGIGILGLAGIGRKKLIQ